MSFEVKVWSVLFRIGEGAGSLKLMLTVPLTTWRIMLLLKEVGVKFLVVIKVTLLFSKRRRKINHMICDYWIH